MSQANMELRFDLEDGKVQAGLKQVEQAERKLEVAVKAGNRTQKVRLKTENDLANVLAVVEKQERKAMTAAQKRAAASLAAQKSAALLAEMQQKQARQLRMAQGWERAAAQAQLAVDAANQKRAKQRMEDLSKAQEAQRNSLRMGVGAASSFAGGLAAIAAGAVSASAAMRGLIALHEHQLDLARRSDQQARGLKEFVALQAPGAGGQEHVRKTLTRGAALGLTPEQTAEIAQPIQSVVDENGDGRLDAKEQAKFDEDTTAAFRLAQLGISAKDAQTVVTAGRSKGRGGTESADKLIAASDLSAAGPADFARSASAMGQFADSDTALAVATALTKEEKNFEQIPTLVRGAAITLGSAADDSEFSKKYGLKGLSEAEKIEKLREIGMREGKGATAEDRIADFSRGFKNAGLDEEKARALGILVRQGETVASTRAKLGSVEAGLAERKVAGLEDDPLVGSSMRAEQAKAVTALNQLYGSESDAARDKRAAMLQRGAELNRRGASIAVDQETGEAKPWWTPGRIFGGITAAGRNIREQGSMNDFGESGGGGLKGSLDELVKSLRENTEATRANSGAAQRVAPVGGNPANAEEKY